MNTECNGWSNWETWNCALWMSNDAGFWEEEADGFRSREQFAEHIKDFFEQQIEETIGTAGFLTDLLYRSLHRVDWDEIAQHYILNDENDPNVGENEDE